jgi:hypothetical protein
MTADEMLVVSSSFSWRRYAAFPADRFGPVKEFGLFPTSGARDSQLTALDTETTQQTYLRISNAEERIAEKSNYVREDHNEKENGLAQ